MKLSQLRFARAVAEESSFSRAAELCHVTQPTLSSGIAQLETELGAKLFNRTTRHVELTPFGRHMLPLVEQVLDASEDLTAAAQAYFKPDMKILRIGLSPVIDMNWVTTVLAPYRRTNPDVQIFFKQCFLSDLGERIQDGRVDVALWPEGNSEGNLIEVPIYEDPLYLLDGGALQDKGSSSRMWVGHVSEEPIILTPDICGLARAVCRIFDDEGVDLNAYPGHALSYEVMQEWADLGIGVAILPKSKLSNGHSAAKRRLVDGNGRQFRLKLVGCWNQSEPVPPHVLAFRSHIAEVGPKLRYGEETALLGA